MEDLIRFGTDGWRARIAEDYTFANVRRCAQGFATFLKNHGRAGAPVVVGYDQRFAAEAFGAAAADSELVNPSPCRLVLPAGQDQSEWAEASELR